MYKVQALVQDARPYSDLSLVGLVPKIIRPRRILLNLARDPPQILCDVTVRVLPEEQTERRVFKLAELVDLLDALDWIAPVYLHSLLVYVALVKVFAHDGRRVRRAGVCGVLRDRLELRRDLGDEASRQDGGDL